MKARPLGISIAFAIMLISISIGVNAQMGGPSDDTMGPGSGPGMNGNEPQGPRWEQQTENHQVEKGMMFRYGKETPEVSIESEDTGKDIGIEVSQIRFRNQTHDLSIQVEDVMWEIDEEETKAGIKATYKTNSHWRIGQDPSYTSSEIKVQYRYSDEEDNRAIEYNITVKNSPAKGNLSISLSVETRSLGGGCCWGEGKMFQQMKRNTYTLTNSDGKELSHLNVGNEGVVDTGEEELLLEAHVNDEIVNSTASFDIKMALPMDTRSASIGGSLIILDELVDEFKEVAEFVIDHIYYFAGAAVVMTVIIIAGITLVSKKRIDTNGNELDLGSNKYYRGPQ